MGLALGILLTGSASRILRLQFVLPLVLVIGWLALFTKRLWATRVVLDPEVVILSNFLNPLSFSTVFIVSLGLFCLVQVLARDSRPVFRDPYRSALTGLAVVGPFLLSFFPYNPLRYYVPLLPAYVLLVLEWLHLRYWRRPANDDVRPLGMIVGIPLTAVTLFMIGQGVNHHILHNVPIALGETPGISKSFIEEYFLVAFLPLSLAGAIFVWHFRDRVLTPKIVVRSFATLLFCSFVTDALMIGSFLLRPSFQSRIISSDLVDLIPEYGSVGGDWAPFLTLGTDIPAIYMYQEANAPSRLPELRPTHFLFSETWTSLRQLEGLQQEEKVKLGPPLYESSYIDRKVVLYPLIYSEDTG
jgi:hypothetical protein